jgi:hypothetical protein
MNAIAHSFGREVITQGKEYSNFAKVDDRWRYKTRRIVSGTTPPADWKE